MKNIVYLILIFTFKFSISHAQEILVMERGEIIISNDTAIIGDSLTVKYVIKNQGNASYSGEINTLMRTNFEKTPLKSSVTKTVNSGDSISIETKFKIISPYFQPNQKTIVVIWPTGTGTVIYSDTLKKTVNTIGAVSVNEQSFYNSHVRLFPNPTNNILHIENLNSEKLIQSVTVSDLKGRMLHNKISSNFNQLNLEDYLPGVYYINIQFSDKTEINLRAIKSE